MAQPGETITISDETSEDESVLLIPIKKVVRKKKKKVTPKKKKIVQVVQKSTSMDFLKRVDDLSLDGNVAENWRRFKNSYMNFELAAGIIEKKAEQRIAIFLNAVGEDGRELFNTFSLSQEEKKDFDTVFQAFEDHCVPKTKVVYERYCFYKRDQRDGEPFDNFLMDIRKLVKTCKFGTDEQTDSMLRDRIVLGVCDPKLQEKLLQMDDLNYDKAVDTCKTYAVARTLKEELQGQVSVHQLATKAKYNLYDNTKSDEKNYFNKNKKNKLSKQ
jgi:hypothetical protein